jgi:uncharacterized protein HemX
MSFKDGLAGDRMEGEEVDPVLDEALAKFRLSVRAWSEAEFNRPRVARALAPRRGVWQLASAWALGLALVTGAVSGGVYERHVKQVRIAAVLEAQRQRQLAANRAREEEELLAKVDSDVSRQVPSAMEPLAQLMAEDETR